MFNHGQLLLMEAEFPMELSAIFGMIHLHGKKVSIWLFSIKKR